MQSVQLPKLNLNSSPSYFWLLLAGWFFGGVGVTLALAWGFKLVTPLTPAIVSAGIGTVFVLSGSIWRRVHVRLKQETVFRALVECFDDVFFRVDNNGNLQYLSAAWEPLAELARSESLGQPLSRFIHPEEQNYFAQLLEQMREQEGTRVSGEMRLATTGGNWRWVEFVIKEFSLPRGDGKEEWAGIIRNITTKRQTEKALCESEMRCQNILQNIQDVYFEISLDGLLSEISPSAERVIGQCRDRLIGKAFATLCADDSAARLVMDQLEKQKKIVDHEIELLDRSGAVVTCAIHARLMFDDQGKPLKFVGTLQDISEQKQAEQEIHQFAFYDILTGLPNRSLFNDRLEQALAQAKRHNRLLAVLCLDLDRFKDVNDTLGHSCGDRLLQTVAQRLSTCVRKGDTVARLGGDEFVVILTSVNGDRDVSRVAEKIIVELGEAVIIDDHEVFTSSSAGVVMYPQDGGDAESLMKHADMALYEAKGEGRNNYQFFNEEMNRHALDRHQLKFKLQRALERNEFTLYYQPQWDMQSRQLVGLEALLRWTTEEDGMIPPSQFIPVAEDTGLIRPIGEWVMRTACRQLKAWQQMRFSGLRMAVNISSRQFRQPDLVSKIDQILAETGLNPQCLELELTESYLMEDPQAAIRTLEFLKVRGIQLAIDDFGTGYSSLSYLKNFPIDRIKIDQSFIREVTVNPDDAAIVEAIIAMGQSLELDMIAEGVEGSEQLKFLLSRNCFEMQGYFFARPMPAADMERYLHDCYRRKNSSIWMKGNQLGTDLSRNAARIDSGF